MRPAALRAAPPSPTAKPPASPQVKAELPRAPAAAQPKPSESAIDTPLSSQEPSPFENQAVSASPKNSARSLTPGPVCRAAAKVNLNTASRAELESLPRVGPAMAKRIIQGRPYRSLDDLDKVKGIGPKMLELLAPLVSF